MAHRSHPSDYEEGRGAAPDAKIESDRFSTDGYVLLQDGVRLDAGPSAHAMGIALIRARGRILAYDEIALILGSRTVDPANLVKVHLHDLRSCTGGSIPIRSHRGLGLSWRGSTWGPASENEDRVTFVGTAMHVDGSRVALTPLSAKIVRYLWLRRDGTHDAASIARAIGSMSRNPANVVKVSMHAVRRAFREIGLTSPLRSVRGRGACWSEVTSLAEHDVAQADAHDPGDQHPPR